MVLELVLIPVLELLLFVLDELDEVLELELEDVEDEDELEVEVEVELEVDVEVELEVDVEVGPSPPGPLVVICDEDVVCAVETINITPMGT